MAVNLIPTFSDEHLNKAANLRKTVSVPAELDSQYFLARMFKVWNTEEEVREKLFEYLNHRKLLGYDRMDDMAILSSNPLTKSVFERFAISRVFQHVRSDNTHVFIQKMNNVHLKEILKVVPASNILHSYFALQDMFGRVLAKSERETGKPSGVVTVLDLAGLNLTEFINPMSVSCRLARLIVLIWADYFSETLLKILIINPPGIVSLMWQISRHILDSRTANRIAFLSSPHELSTFLHPNAIPVEYGGTWRDDSGFSHPPEGCCSLPKQVTPNEHRSPHRIWEEHSVDAPESHNFSVKAKKTHDCAQTVSSSGSLVWSFTTSGDIYFEVLRVDNGKEIPVWPRIRLASHIVPEEGFVKVSPGQYVYRFSNPSSSWFAIKIHHKCAIAE